jgi:hypothetical protein
MTPNAAAVMRGELIGERYQLERILGQGGMGTVWVARDLQLARLVAVKFLGQDAAKSAAQRARFGREALLASKVRSQHVVQVFGAGTTPTGVLYVVMELLDGESLATRIARTGRCSLADTAAIVEQVCRGLHKAHREGLVHRDIKPANIFLTPEPDGSVFVRLLDFGIAKDVAMEAHGLTQSGEVLGTGYYMSPEQLRAPRTAGPPTDLWALGVVIYEMLTGRVPFDAATFPGLVVCVVEGKFAPLSQWCPELPPALDHFLLRVLQPDPARRFGNADELGHEFARIVRGHSSEAVVKPELLRILRRHGTATYRMPARQRIAALTTKYLHRDAAGPRRVALLVFALLGLALAGLLAQSWSRVRTAAHPSTSRSAALRPPAPEQPALAQPAARAPQQDPTPVVEVPFAPVRVEPGPAANKRQPHMRHRRGDVREAAAHKVLDAPAPAAPLPTVGGDNDEHNYGF